MKIEPIAIATTSSTETSSMSDLLGNLFAVGLAQNLGQMDAMMQTAQEESPDNDE